LMDYIMLDSNEREKHRVEIDRVHPVIQRSMEGDLVKVDNPTIAEMRKIAVRENSTTLEKFHLQISQHELYPGDSELVDELVHEMATEPILHVCK
jgi:hypothetical protein